MTVATVTIKPHENLENWHIVTFTSRKDPIGQTTVEMLMSEETLRWWRNQIDKSLKKDK